MTGNDAPRYCGATAHRTPLKLCRLLISSRNTDVSSERKWRHHDFGPNTPIFYRLIMKPGSGRVFHVCFIRSITLIFQQRMWITNQINQEKTCFTLSDPHADTHYSDVVSDIRSESIWHTYIYIFWHSFWHILWHSIWQLFWHSIWRSIWHVFGSRRDPLHPELFGPRRDPQEAEKWTRREETLTWQVGKKHMYDSLVIELCKENFLLSTGKQQIVTYIHWECIHVHIYELDM